MIKPSWSLVALFRNARMFIHWCLSSYPKWVYEQATDPVTLENFRNGFNNSFSRKKAAVDIFDAAVSKKLPLPEPFYTSDHEELRKRIKQLCRDHLNQILHAYEESFSAGYWKTYRQTKVGYYDFLRVANTLNKIPNECVTDFKRKFCRTLYMLRTKGCFHSLDNGTVQKYLAEDCGFLDGEIEAWCLMPQSGPGRKLPWDITGNS